MTNSLEKLLIVLSEKMKKKKKKHVYCDYYDASTTYFDSILLHDKCPNAELFLVRILINYNKTLCNRSRLVHHSSTYKIP